MFTLLSLVLQFAATVKNRESKLSHIQSRLTAKKASALRAVNLL